MTALLAPTTNPLHRPTATVGIIGGGRLGRMMHHAAIALGIEVVVLTDDPDAPAVAAGASLHRGRADDLDTLLGFAERCDVVTTDGRALPLDVLDAVVAAGHVVRPRPEAVHLALDTEEARRSFAAAGLPVVTSTAPDRVTHEVTVLVARRPSGQWRTYPIAQTVVSDGDRCEVLFPALIDAATAERAVRLATTVADGIDATGILAVELVVADDGEVSLDRISTGPHEHGHASIDATTTSQFENHLRGVLDWPLGATDLVTPAAASVVLVAPNGDVDVAARLPVCLEDADVQVHLARSAPRPGEALGHVTALGITHDDALERARHAARSLLSP